MSEEYLINYVLTLHVMYFSKGKGKKMLFCIKQDFDSENKVIHVISKDISIVHDDLFYFRYFIQTNNNICSMITVVMARII